MQQHTINSSITVSGIGVHSGVITEITFHPAPENFGVKFKRTDVTNKNNIIPASFLNVTKTELGTTISNSDNIEVATIEHLMSAIWGAKIDNLLIDINNIEVPILDGSSTPFIFALESAGTKKQEAKRKFLKIKKTIRVKNNDIYCQLEKSDNFIVTLNIEFKSKAIGKQSFTFDNSKDCFATTIGRSRTFGHLNEVEFLKSKGLARGGSLENAVVVDNNKIINPEGLRNANEFAKHKILDAIGDLYLCSTPIIGKFIGHKSGHDVNNKLLRKLFADKENYEII